VRERVMVREKERYFIRNERKKREKLNYKICP